MIIYQRQSIKKEPSLTKRKENEITNKTLTNRMIKLMSKYNIGTKAKLKEKDINKNLKNMMIKSTKIPQQNMVETKTKKNEWKNNSLKIQS